MLEASVGKTITVSGVVSNSKVPSVSGVFVDHGLDGHCGRVVTVRGTLRKQVITKEQEQANAASAEPVAMMGAGTSYWLEGAEVVETSSPTAAGRP